MGYILWKDASVAKGGYERDPITTVTIARRYSPNVMSTGGQ